MLVRNNRYGLAESLCRHALPASNAAFGVDHEATLAIVQDLGVTLYFQGRDSEAEDFFRQVLAASIDSESEAALLALKWLSLTLLYRGKNKEAFTVHQRALTALRKKHGSDHDAVLEWGRRFSNVLQGQLHENSKLFDVEECEPGSKLRRRLSERLIFNMKDLTYPRKQRTNGASLTALVRGFCKALLRACPKVPAVRLWMGVCSCQGYDTKVKQVLPPSRADATREK